MGIGAEQRRSTRMLKLNLMTGPDWAVHLCLTVQQVPGPEAETHGYLPCRWWIRAVKAKAEPDISFHLRGQRSGEDLCRLPQISLAMLGQMRCELMRLRPVWNDLEDAFLIRDGQPQQFVLRMPRGKPMVGTTIEGENGTFDEIDPFKVESRAAKEVIEALMPPLDEATSRCEQFWAEVSAPGYESGMSERNLSLVLGTNASSHLVFRPALGWLKQPTHDEAPPLLAVKWLLGQRKHGSLDEEIEPFESGMPYPGYMFNALKMLKDAAVNHDLRIAYFLNQGCTIAGWKVRF